MSDPRPGFPRWSGQDPVLMVHFFLGVESVRAHAGTERSFLTYRGIILLYCEKENE